jgi:hypothetical protein
MKKWIKFSGIVIISALLLIIALYKFVYNKPHPDYASSEVFANFTAEELYLGYKNSGEQFNQKYTGKVIAISGTTTKIEVTEELTVVIFVFEQGDFGDQGIRCTMLPGSKTDIKNIKPNSIVKIKGFCTGFNDTDVILEKCTIIQ